MKKIEGFEINGVKFAKSVAQDSNWYEEKEYNLNGINLTINEMREVIEAIYSLDHELFYDINR